MILMVGVTLRHAAVKARRRYYWPLRQAATLAACRHATPYATILLLYVASDTLLSVTYAIQAIATLRHYGCLRADTEMTAAAATPLPLAADTPDAGDCQAMKSRQPREVIRHLQCVRGGMGMRYMFTHKVAGH